MCICRTHRVKQENENRKREEMERGREKKTQEESIKSSDTEYSSIVEENKS